MSPKSISRNSVDSCLIQLNSWKPFSNSKTLDLNPNPNPKSSGIHPKRPCLTDRTTSLFSLSIDAIDFSKLSLFDEPKNHRNNHQSRMEKLRWSSSSAAKKRRRKCGGSRSVSGRSSDRCRSLAGAATGSDFIMGKSGAGAGAGTGTDSSGELFGNVNGGWGSDVGEGRRESSNLNCNVGGEVGFGFDGVGGSESGYGSEPGYRGDVEFGYGDEVDDDDEEGARLLFLWGRSLSGDSNTEMVGENTFSEQKTHHRGRRKKHDLRMVDSVR